jgi:membrane protease YdiL (CAAX protease family)
LPVILLVVALAVRLARGRFADYLGLKPADARTFGLGLACTLAYLAAVDLFGYMTGRGLEVQFVVDIVRTASETGTWPLVLIAVVVAAPIAEEVVFRGFLFRGWSTSRIGVTGTILLTSAIWAGLHTQYDLITMGQIFGIGLLFGWLRARSGSTLMMMQLHGIYSLGVLIQGALLAR